jgi:putative DNA primase/helicase
MTTEQELPIFHGCGANGKSTLLDAVQNIMGEDFSGPAAPDLLLAKKGQQHPTERKHLKGMRLVTCVENDEGMRLSESLVKQLTGDAKLTARGMRENFTSFVATHKLILATNHVPEVRGTDYAIWRRLRLIPFGIVIDDARKDKRLGAKLAAEAEGILRWMVDGCAEWQRYGLGEPPAVLDATEGYRANQDVLAEFIGKCCIVNSGCSVGASELFDAYTDFGGGLSQTRFGKALAERGFERGRFSFGPHRGRTSWTGIGLIGGDTAESAEF